MFTFSKHESVRSYPSPNQVIRSTVSRLEKKSNREYSPATADAWGGTMSFRFGALEDPLMTAVLNRLLADPVSFLLTLYPKSLK